LEDRVEFGLLGPLVVRAGDAPVVVSAGKQRVLLAALLLRANQVVASAELAEAVWEGSPPETARVTLQNYVKRLRRVLGPAGYERIVTRPAGYVIEVGPGELDVARFAELRAGGLAAVRAGAWDSAVAQLGTALGLWRGQPLADVPSQVLMVAEVPRLAGMRLEVAEGRIDAELHLGRHREVIAELQALAGAEPLQERLHELLMLALYRSGQQAAALAAYQQARRQLIDKLGIEPGPGLRELNQKILQSDPALLPAPSPATVRDSRLPARRPGAAADGSGGGRAEALHPSMLPAAVAGFAGRSRELAALSAMTGGGPVLITAIGGTAGVGKTALALQWAHQAATRFPDGQLYVNLRGFDPTGTPAAPAEAIWGFLDALGVPPGRIPPTLDARAGLYRSLLAERRMLIVLDNARDEQQVRPLLPGSPCSLVLVTSRSQLGGLAAGDGARLLTLDVLSHAEAVQMLTARLGTARAAAEPEALSEVASLCACLPLALAVAAARAAARPRFPLAVLAAELADSAGRLDALDAGDPGSSVRVVFSWSIRQLTSEAARMFRLLGIHPGPDISVPAAASLAGRAQPQAHRLLRELARAHLIAEHVPGRYAIHDLLRAYAAEQARHTSSDTDRHAATGRALDHYLHTAASAARLLDPGKEPVVLALLRPGAAAGQPADHRQALAWFEAEHQVLRAAVALAAGSGFDSHAWQLPWAMAPFLQARGHWQEYAATQRTALAAATRLGDITAQALSGRLLANACTNLGDHDQARGHFASSLTLCQRLGNRLGEARIHQSLSVLANGQGRYADALGHDEQALRLFRAIGDKANEAGALNAVGWDHGLLGDYQQARAFCRQALTLSAEAGHRWIEGHAWDSLGYAEHHLGNLAEAAACYQRALSLFREAGDRSAEADTLTHLGDTRQAAGQQTQAREAWHQALAILEDLQHPHAGQVRAKLASTNDHASRNPSA
jgi:DNA-binding SARP family transcriptional activator/tetratricopeptide (TPR) repeat protein